MNKKIKKCKICQAEIAASAKSCPHCGAKNKKALIKKWWFWLIVIFFIFSIIALSGEDTTTQTSTSDNVTKTTAAENNTEKNHTEGNENNTTKETTEKDETIESTPLDIYTIIAVNNDPSFSISEKSASFIREHEDFFPGSTKNKGAISDYVDENITYGHLAKNISKYEDKLISVYGTVIDISEADDGSITYLHILDYDGNSYTLYFLGALDDVFNGTTVSAYALPLTMTTFENMQAQYTEAVLGAACYVEAF